MSFYKDDIAGFAVMYKQIEIHTNKLFIGWVSVPRGKQENAILCSCWAIANSVHASVHSKIEIFFRFLARIDARLICLLYLLSFLLKHKEKTAEVRAF